jgi:glycosyltransferase involved in cell wall biosynthesis
MVKLSVVIITFNEERNIGRCIDSVKDIADDILILDSYSTDKTEEIAKAKGARFVQHVFDGHIEQKNRAISLALYPYILSLDADEALDDVLKSEIIKVKKNWTHDGYEMNRLTNYCGKWIKHSGWYPDTKLRLWDSRKGRWTGINPHDKYEMDSNATITKLKGNILHYSYYTIHDHIKQVNYFTEIAANAYYQKGKKSSLPKILLSPVIKFIRDYFLKLGILDGYYGLIICIISSHATFIKYVKLKQLWDKQS